MFSFEYFLTSFFNKVLNNVTVATCIGDIYEFDTPITIEGECVLRNDHSVNGYHPTVGLFGHLHIPIMHSQ